MSGRAPSLADSGVQAGPAGSEERRAFAGPVTIAAARPTIFVSINGVLQPTVSSAQWRAGRDGWFSDLVPSTASIGFTDAVTGEIGDEVMIMTETGLLWRGRVETIANDKQLSTGAYEGSVTAVDRLAALGISEYTGVLGSASGYTLATLIPFVMGLIGIDPVTIVEGDSATALPALVNTTLIRGRTMLEYIQLAERSSNALMTLQPDGSLLAVTRDALSAGSVDVLDLVGPNAPRAWKVEELKSSVINKWLFTDAGSTVRLDTSDTASIEEYGENAYIIDDYMDDDVDHWSSALRTAVASPRPVVTRGEFPITSTDQAVLHLKPLDWVSFDGDTWQVMSVEHNVTVSEWSLTITADVSQNYMAGAAEPTPTDPDPSPPTLDTQTATSTKSATAFLSSGGAKYGNGAGNFLPVGFYLNTRTRAFIDFPTITKPAGFIRVRRATLNLRTSGQDWVAFGGKPKLYARRVTESWTEGTFDAAAPNQYSASNALVWPGPSTTKAGQTLKSLGGAEDTERDIDVTEIVEAAFRAGAFHGIALISANEDSKVNTIEFCSDDHGTTAARPSLTVICDVE